MTTILFTDTHQFADWLATKRDSTIVGFVPTMGALHEGHGSLFELARSQCDLVIASIYVNNLQFNSSSDFDRYPRTLDEDVAMCQSRSVDAVWAPSQLDLFPDGQQLLTTGENALEYEGRDRPGHFVGVATVVDRLLSIVAPDRMYLGAKDHQQISVIASMCSQLHQYVNIVRCPTIREHDGLAISSRNRFLTQHGRSQAPIISLALQHMIDTWRAGETEPTTLIAQATSELQNINGATVHYIAVLDGHEMQLTMSVKQGDTAIIAVSIDNVRLIDNMQFVNV
ncbi:MAG: hypothetical protein ABR57_05975 [Acidimicrobium sp. BACL17 MAG-120924-bin0]|nr:MAG: hypothetical protein ABR57_05975 [Acidimicrobium sp. BACL17 MAG-120924-bin0]